MNRKPPFTLAGDRSRETDRLERADSILTWALILATAGLAVLVGWVLWEAL